MLAVYDTDISIFLPGPGNVFISRSLEAGKPILASLNAMVPHWKGHLAFEDGDGDKVLLLVDDDVETMLEVVSAEVRCGYE